MVVAFFTVLQSGLGGRPNIFQPQNQARKSCRIR
jgi:hypothetical protein